MQLQSRQGGTIDDQSQYDKLRFQAEA